MVSSRIAFRARKLIRPENKGTLSTVNITCDVEAGAQRGEPSGDKIGKEDELVHAVLGSENPGFILSEKSERTTNRVDGRTDQPALVGEVEDGARRTNKNAGKRKRNLHGRAASQAEEEFKSTAHMTVTSLFEPGAIADAINHLKKCDPKLRAIIETQELPSFQNRGSAFFALVQSIVYQQLATKAADAILQRLVNLCGGDALVTPSTISELPASELRNIGISLRKASYLHDLAKTFSNGELTDASISLMEDETLMSTLTAVKGIGTWSVHMFMIFSLHRPDVLPVGDLGIRKGFQKLYNLPSLPSPIEMEKLSAAWRPYRSLGSWYIWRLMEPKPRLATSQEES